MLMMIFLVVIVWPPSLQI